MRCFEGGHAKHESKWSVADSRATKKQTLVIQKKLEIKQKVIQELTTYGKRTDSISQREDIKEAVKNVKAPAIAVTISGEVTCEKKWYRLESRVLPKKSEWAKIKEYDI